MIKFGILRRWCDQVGRDEAEIERTTQGAVGVVIRDSVAEAERVAAEIRRHNGDWDGPEFAGTPEGLVEKLAQYPALGFRHFYFDCPAPYDDESLVRLVGEVKPMLEQASM